MTTPRSVAAREQRRVAIVLANEQRVKLKDLRGRLRSGDTSLRDVLHDERDLIGRYPVWEILRWQRGYGDWRAVELNRWAISDGRNLALPVDRLSPGSVEWLRDRLPGGDVYAANMRPPDGTVTPFSRVPSAAMRPAYERALQTRTRAEIAEDGEWTVWSLERLFRRQSMTLRTAERLSRVLGVPVPDVLR